MKVVYIHKKDHEKGSYEATAANYKLDTEPMAEEKEEIILPDGFEQVLKAVVETMEHKPETWKKYENLPNGLWEIIRMEASELEKAYTGMRNAEVSHEKFKKELLHLCSAVVMAYHKMLKKEE